MNEQRELAGLQRMSSFTLIEALLGRRSRRFFMGAEIPDGPLAYRSRHAPRPLSELETLLVVSACGGSTSWHHMIHRAARYAPHLSNYSAAAGGRTFPSAAGFHTSKTFFTDDNGVYLLDVRDRPLAARRSEQGTLSLAALTAEMKECVLKLQERRLDLPAEPPYTEPHNTWVTNGPGSLLVIPVGDLSQHVLLALCYMLQNGLVLFDDINRRPVPGIERFKHLVDTGNVWPLTFVEQWSLAEISVELGTSCYAGALMLQAMGLGGWMFNGLDPFSVLGAGRDKGVRGLGFHCETQERWPYPNPTGLAGVMEGSCPPHFPDMRAALEAVCARKFGPGGPFHPETPGPWKETSKIRAAAERHGEDFKECVALQAQYILDTFGKFPGTVPSMLVLMYLQAHHLDLEFYVTYYQPGAYLETHAAHMRDWHDPNGT